jgi:hypothetical protein
MREQIVWSHPHSGCQAFLLNDDSVKGGALSSTMVPSHLQVQVKNEIRKLGSRVSIDKLALALRWTKASENYRAYGPLKAALRSLIGVFYDPDFMYSRDGLTGLIYPEDALDDNHVDDERSLEGEYWGSVTATLAIIGHIRANTDQQLHIDDATRIIVSAGLKEAAISRLSHIFVPGDALYLRASAPSCSTNVAAGSIEEDIIFSLESGNKSAASFNQLVSTLSGSGRYSIHAIDVLREDIVKSCADPRMPGDSIISKYCFYDPEHVYARDWLQAHIRYVIPPHRITKPSAHTNADVGEVGGVLHAPLPGWCVEDALVRTIGSDDEWVICKICPPDSVEVKLHSAQESESVLREVEDIYPVEPRRSHMVLVLEGPHKGHKYPVAGVTPPLASIQLSKYEFKSFPLSQICPVKA